MHYSMEDPSNIYQQLGIIQGTLTSLGNTVTNGFSAANKQVTDFKEEFRDSTVDQNVKIDALSSRIEHLEQFKSNYEGGKEEAARTARWSGGTTGAVVGGLVTGLLQLINYVVHNMPK